MVGFRNLVGLGLAAAMLAGAPLALAQNPFDPRITVNGAAVTEYELDQRQRLMAATGTTGDIAAEARLALIDERLMLAAAQGAGIRPTPEEVEAEMEAFVQRGNVTLEDFRRLLDQNGIEFDSYREFIETRLSWREFVRARFVGRVRVTEEEIDRALALQGGGLRVRLGEIVLPAEADREQALAFAVELKRSIGSLADFERAARRYSASNSRAEGGVLDWVDLATLAPPIRAALTTLSPGDLAEPIQTDRAVILLQLRAMAEGATRRAPVAAIEFMLLRMAGAGTEATARRLAEVAATTDTCNDLWAWTDVLGDRAITRETLAPAAIPPRIRAELEWLDDNEISTRLTSEDGREAWALMLCGRSAALPADESREDVAQRLRSQRIDQLAESYLAELRASAEILRY